MTANDVIQIKVPPNIGDVTFRFCRLVRGKDNGEYILGGIDDEQGRTKQNTPVS